MLRRHIAPTLALQYFRYVVCESAYHFSVFFLQPSHRAPTAPSHKSQLPEGRLETSSACNLAPCSSLIRWRKLFTSARYFTRHSSLFFCILGQHHTPRRMYIIPATKSIHDDSCTSRAKKRPGPGSESGDWRTRLMSSIFSSNARFDPASPGKARLDPHRFAPALPSRGPIPGPSLL